MFDSEAITLAFFPAVSIILGMISMWLLWRGKTRAAILVAVATLLPVGLGMWLNSLEGQTREFWMTAAPYALFGSIVLTGVALGVGAVLGSLAPNKK